jgi:hypothetical protein
MGIPMEVEGACDRAYWTLKRDPSEDIPRGSVIGVFSDGVSKVTAGTPSVGVVPHTPDTVEDLPPTETRNPDGTYSSNQHCLMAFVGEVPVRVSADFIPPRVSGPLFLMPSGKNDGLATAHDGSGRILGYMKPGTEAWKTDAGHFVKCCVHSAGGASTPHANGSNQVLRVKRRQRPRTTKGTRKGHGRRNSGDIPARPTVCGWGVESKVMKLLNGCSKAAVKTVLIGFLPWLFSLILSILVGLDSVKFDGCDKPANASYDVGFTWFSLNVTGKPHVFSCFSPEQPDKAASWLRFAQSLALLALWGMQNLFRLAAWALSVAIWEAAVAAWYAAAYVKALVLSQPQPELASTFFLPDWIRLSSFSALSALFAFIIACPIALLLLRVPPASWCVTMLAEILSRLLLSAANLAKIAITRFRRCRYVKATVPWFAGTREAGYAELSTSSDSGSSDSDSGSEVETLLPPDPDAVGASAV